MTAPHDFELSGVCIIIPRHARGPKILLPVKSRLIPMHSGPIKDSESNLLPPLFLSVCVLLGFVCTFLLWVFSCVACQSVAGFYGARPLPVPTTFLRDYHLLILLSPLPWLFATIFLVRQRSYSLGRLLAFSTTLILSLLAITIFVGIAQAFPWLPIYTGLKGP
ncbi:MAG: hypothetical protein V4710_21165 [Verrucomicrobiota bacterium]